MLDVRQTNLSVQLLFREMRILVISLLGDFYEDTMQVAYRLQCRYVATLAEAEEVATSRTCRTAE